MTRTLRGIVGLMLFTALTSSGQGQSSQSYPDNQIETIEYPVALRSAMPARAASAGTFDYNMAGPINSAHRFTEGTAGNKVASAFQMPPEVTTEFAGKRITEISFYTGINGNSRTNAIPEMTVFLADGDHKKPFYTQTISVGTAPWQAYTVKLNEPYTIEAGKDLFVGCYGILTSPMDYSIVIDNIEHNSPVGGWKSRSTTVDDDFNWEILSPNYVCVSAMIEGNNFPQDKASLELVSVPEVAEAGSAVPVTVTAMNLGQNLLESIELEYTVGDSGLRSAIVGFGLTSMQTGYGNFEIKIPSPGIYDMTFKLVKVNGKNVSDSKQLTAKISVMPQGGGFTPNVVLEEFTGTWCGACPAGYITMEYIHENYKDGSFIPVCIHDDNDMPAGSYNDAIFRFNSAGTYPNSIMNRNTAYSSNGKLYPFPASSMEALYNEIRSKKIPESVSLKCRFTDDSKTSIVFEGNTEFSLDFASHDYTLSFGLTEDNVGPYRQNNGYTGWGDAYGEWSSPGGARSVIFNDVARKLETIDGIDGLIPAKIKLGEKYPYSYTMTVPAGVNADNLNGIVYLTNKSTGCIVNAATVKAGNIKVAGVNDVMCDEDNAPVEYYNLQGVKVTNPARGIFIRRQGTKASKVVLR